MSSSGVSMYISKAATAETLRQLVRLEAAARGARASATPWVSFFAPEEIVGLARDAGFSSARYVSTAELAERYLTDRTDGLRAAGGEGVLLART